MTRQEKIKIIRSGQSSAANNEPALFWEIDNEGYYVAGDMRLTKQEFEALSRKKPCYPSRVTDIVYVAPENIKYDV